MNHKNYFFIILILLISLINIKAHLKNDHNGPKQVVDKFIRAFENLDEDALKKTLSEDAKMYTPFTPQIANNIDEIIKVLKPVFKKKENSDLKAPYLNLTPSDMLVNMLDKNAAVVAWHLEREQTIGRRTAVCEKINNKWLIVSFHASTMNK